MFDSNIHLPCKEEGLDERLYDEASMGDEELTIGFNHHLPALKDKIHAGNFMLFNEKLTPNEAYSFTSFVRNVFPEARFTALTALNNPEEAERLRSLKKSGVDAIKFHCYVQKITEEDFPKAMQLAKAADNLNMPIFIDTSYGSTGMYCYDNLKLAAFLLKEITSVPVVLLHSGGARALEAFLLADACPNVYLESSFTLSFYLGSTIEKDLAFAYKKVAERVIYGSDFPYVDLNTSHNDFLKFTQDWNFTDQQIEGFFNNNIKKVFSD